MSSQTRVITPRLERILADVMLYLDERAEQRPARFYKDQDAAELRAELLEAFEEARLLRPKFATVEEALAAIKADPMCPKDASEAQLNEWAEQWFLTH